MKREKCRLALERIHNLIVCRARGKGGAWIGKRNGEEVSRHNTEHGPCEGTASTSALPWTSQWGVLHSRPQLAVPQGFQAPFWAPWRYRGCRVSTNKAVGMPRGHLCAQGTVWRCDIRFNVWRRVQGISIISIKPPVYMTHSHTHTHTHSCLYVYVCVFTHTHAYIYLHL